MAIFTIARRTKFFYYGNKRGFLNGNDMDDNVMEKNTDRWFAGLKRVWIEKDIEGVRELLSTDFEYYENPFGLPLTTWESVRNAWQGVRDQDISKLEILPLISGDTEGMAMYELAFRDGQGSDREVRGAYYVKLDSEGRAIRFRRWRVAA